jgi:diadenosine tetraphosphate (Ap4A) HIT family hydrolase
MECGICAKVAAAIKPGAAETVYADADWVAFSSGDKPGWVMLATLEHADWTWSMTGAQAAGFGPVVAKISEQIRKATDSSKVYFLGLGEAAIHCHFLLIPRVEGLGNDIRAALRKWGEDVGDLEASKRLTEILRGGLKS